MKHVFGDDRSEIETVRELCNDDSNIRAGARFVVLRQPDESDTRGDVIFDIFGLNRTRYWWHFNRGHTPSTRARSTAAEGA